MSFKEVQNCYFEFEDKRHKIIQKTQGYFLKLGFQPYVWFDEEHRLRIKHKFTRGKDFKEIDDERCRFSEIVEKFSEEKGLFIVYLLDVCETDMMLNDDIKSQWSIEYILEV